MVVLNSRVSGILNPFVLPGFVVLPADFGVSDILLLAFLGAASEQDDKLVTVFAEIDPVAFARVDLQFQNAGATPLTFDTLPKDIRVSDVAIFAAACASSSSNQPRNGLVPASSRYSRICTHYR
jgi:hypothetical protein